MKVYDFINLEKFQTWSGATDTKETIIDNNKQGEFEALIREIYPDGITATNLNDLLWHESDWVYESLGITE